MLVVLIYSLLVKMVTSRGKVALRKHSNHGAKTIGLYCNRKPQSMFDYKQGFGLTNDFPSNKVGNG
ncbi:MAG: hypothetical protein ACJATV_001175 [Granulosicoccus sp.]|jgi:hypothetical protein